jgi:geranylgeranyl pyrophosphate synthase/predicted secreted hydrolase
MNGSTITTAATSSSSSSSTSSSQSSPNKRMKLTNNVSTSHDAADISTSTSTSSSVTGEAFIIPDDWPSSDGDIDLHIHDLPHNSADTEWWYLNGHLDVDADIDSNNQSASPSSSSTSTSTSASRQSYSFFASFFRIVQEVNEDNTYKYAHALCWSIIDVTNKVYITDTLLDVDSPQILKEQLDAGIYDVDQRFKYSLLEMLSKGDVPLPDRRMKQSATALSSDTDSNPTLHLQYDHNTFIRNDSDGTYTLRCSNSTKGIAIDIHITPQTPVIRQAYNGVVKVGLKRDTMFYYFLPRCSVNGSLTFQHKRQNIVNGHAWYDHEFGGTFRADMMLQKQNIHAIRHSTTSSHNPPTTNGMTNQQDSNSNSNNNNTSSSKQATTTHDPNPKHKRGYAWNWFSIQLDYDTTVTVTQLIEVATKATPEKVLEQWAIVVAHDEHTDTYTRSEHHNIAITSSNKWLSIRTTQSYPLDWSITIPDYYNMTLRCTAVMDDQEVITLISKPAFWEGCMYVTATYEVPSTQHENGSSTLPTAARAMNGTSSSVSSKHHEHDHVVKGKGWLERQGFGGMTSLEDFFKNMGKETIRAVDTILPSKPTYEQARNLIATLEDDHYMSGVNLDVYAHVITQPLREIIDRGGKSWRSLACLLCVDAVGGNSNLYRHWLAMPEIMHVGSLIIDDIQDQSTHRRGGDACHIIYGNALAINTGCAAYFLSLHILNKMTPNLDAETRLRLYELYFLGLRAGHAGQGFDLYGLDDGIMSLVVETGDNSELCERVLCTHRLKSAVPASCLARMGATIGKGTEKQIRELGLYFEAVGLAFQIIDDVLNVKGFEDNKKDRGEDIQQGKITFVVAMAMSKERLSDPKEREWLYDILKSKPTDTHVIQHVITRLQQSNAVNDSIKYAENLVDRAWKSLDAALHDSFYKMLLRAFGLYVLQRHY